MTYDFAIRNVVCYLKEVRNKSTKDVCNHLIPFDLHFQQTKSQRPQRFYL